MPSVAPPAHAPSRPGADREAVRALRAAVRAALDGLPADAPGRPGRALLAVSGGADSMALLDAAVGVARGRVAGVAVFDHGTGAAARAAVRLVRRVARRHAVPVVVGRASLPDGDEATWRAARWRFLRRAARRLGAVAVATGHTADDQVETVAMRLLRGAGARGLAGLRADRPGVVRPLLGLDAATVRAAAAARGLRWVEDPSNGSWRHLRNRLRHELLPALERARPGMRAWLLALGERAAAWRREVEALADALPVTRSADGALLIATAELAGYDPDGLAILWAALVARAGGVLDRRGRARLLAFTQAMGEAPRIGATIPLAGGMEVAMRRGPDRGAPVYVVRRVPDRTAAPPATPGWRLRPLLPAPDAPQPTEAAGRDDLWEVRLPAGTRFAVRAWRPGDRMRVPGGRAARRVKRFLADARIPGPERPGWPVVYLVDPVGGEEIVWIPGVRLGAALLDPAPGPTQPHRCERHSDRR